MSLAALARCTGFSTEKSSRDCPDTICRSLSMSLSLGALFGKRSYPEKFVYYSDKDIRRRARADRPDGPGA